ncbi:translocation and assembly module lipoprotein TamL [Flavobacterium litorale]|uniref:BamA/TamA family outer membrane protein n=1 Tax=Flavobacterium litorale TaxID=2856519 RepID=A0ABX8VE45_9FLAO|nr:BamA/TamA family outer membrane protein [Flavobacterium litorale]QYJ69433.1 BamA/TamA family outer membrane protein [Flavobacterium litorale]
MRNKTTKIALFILSGFLFYSCSLIKRVPDGKHLLEKNDIVVNGESKNTDELKAQLYQQPNSSILGYHLRLHLYNLAKPNADSSYQAWLDRKPGRRESLQKLLSDKQVQRLGNSFIVSGYSKFLKKVGEPPVIVDPARVRKSANRLMAHYYKQGFFRTKIGFSIDTLGNKKAKVNYNVTTGKPYVVDSITPYIATPVLDSLYQTTTKKSVLKSNKQYNESDFTEERERITTFFRNRGAYTFQQNNISYVVDTVNTGYKANVDLIIDDQTIREEDTTYTRPFKLYKIKEVNIYTKNPADESQAIDSTSHKGFNIFSTGKINYRSQALTNPVFIMPGSIYSDSTRILTSRYLNNLRVFDYPTIEYIIDSTNTNEGSLITNIYLTPRERFKFIASIDLTHSNIQDVGIEGSTGISIRNLFRGAEILDLTVRGNIGSSSDPDIADQSFFNILEYGADAKLSFPRLFFPFNTDIIIPKSMIPSTLMTFGISRQQNIGLDKESFSGVLNYNWTPKENVTARLDFFNIQYVRNVNPQNYFNVYNTSYDRLNDIANSYVGSINPDYFVPDDNPNNDKQLIIESGTDGFIDDVTSDAITVSANDKQDVRSIEERKNRLTENNLIASSNFTYTTTSRENLTDNGFFIFKTKIETAGNALALLSSLTDSGNRSASGNKTILDVEYSQYVKGEVDFIKHFDLKQGKVLAMRAFFGLAVPYGNSKSIPFIRSYFAGGSNDNRAWQSYSLGPGRSGGLNDFNEANLKMAYSAELRFDILGQLKGAVFGDVGNIWNVFDDQDDPDYTFNGLSSLQDLALGSGFGIRYDFNFFVIRLDLGFKTYDPGRPVNDRWFKEYNLANAVYNVGINYPF